MKLLLALLLTLIAVVVARAEEEPFRLKTWDKINTWRLTTDTSEVTPSEYRARDDRRLRELIRIRENQEEEERRDFWEEIREEDRSKLTYE